MALRFMDSFDHYATATIPSKYNSISGSPTIGSGRNGNGLSLPATSTARQAHKVLDAQATWIVGMAVTFSVITDSTSCVFLQLRDGGTNQVDVRCVSTGYLQVTRNGTILATASVPLVNGVWYYVELKVTINNTGSFELRMNGVNVASSGSADTYNAGNVSADRLVLSGVGQTGADNNVVIDDLYVLDGTGSAPYNDFLGDCRVECIHPSGNGNSSQFDGSDGNSTDNYLLVDETTPPDGDTTYVESSDVGDKDTYVYGNLVTTAGTIYGLQPIPYMRKTEAGARTAATVARLSGTEEDSSGAVLLDTYIYRPDVRTTKPGGGTWSVTDVNSAEFGVKVAS